MTLRVPFEGFAAAAREVIGVERVYALEGAGGTYLSAGRAEGGAVVLCRVERPLSALRDELAKQGLIVCAGAWSLDGAAEMPTIPWITAIAYRTGGEHPGVWVDAHFESRPSGASLQLVYDEFAAAGELGETTFDEFITAAAPTVVEIAPENLFTFARRNTEAE